MPDFNEGSVCPRGKVCYETEAEAQSALERIIEQRLEEGVEKPPERQVYKCNFCDHWHLSSQSPELDENEPPRSDGESWESYALRLEDRIRGQRAQLDSLNQLRIDAGNRAERKRSEKALLALGKERVANHDLAAMNRALVEKLREHGLDNKHDK